MIIRVPCEDGDHIDFHRPEAGLEVTTDNEELLDPWPERFRLMHSRQDVLARKAQAAEKRRDSYLDDSEGSSGDLDLCSDDDRRFSCSSSSPARRKRKY